MLRKALIALGLLAGLASGGGASAQTAPTEIKIGHIHATSGPYAAISMPSYYGLQIWVNETNAAGGVMVKPLGKKLPLKLISSTKFTDGLVKLHYSVGKQPAPAKVTSAGERARRS